MKVSIRKFLMFMGVVAAAGAALAAETGEAAASRTASETIALAAAAALTMAVSVLGAGAAVGRIGSAALGAAAEKPDLLTRSILFVALAEGLAVLGFAIAIMLVQKII
jgi:V/A-type H+/Na+-transporting ATPase subunit K